MRPSKVWQGFSGMAVWAALKGRHWTVRYGAAIAVIVVIAGAMVLWNERNQSAREVEAVEREISQDPLLQLLAAEDPDYKCGAVDAIRRGLAQGGTKGARDAGFKYQASYVAKIVPTAIKARDETVAAWFDHVTRLVTYLSSRDTELCANFFLQRPIDASNYPDDIRTFFVEINGALAKAYVEGKVTLRIVDPKHGEATLLQALGELHDELTPDEWNAVNAPDQASSSVFCEAERKVLSKIGDLPLAQRASSWRYLMSAGQTQSVGAVPLQPKQ